ncbi:Transmembrane domain-containing protein [Spironucleus salmonicida]|uniref:Transmembrane domain-containing protein n=1 Tax=Spironucleus salmonicida TaxID=348837 RepID=V6LPK2_9EUKA|nr:Transmembrane domain-containing protein [Spironucleus salmonicida]|eukprot:EST46607.1 Transmembrane domain-containing protein [Spironucleus salmonicida]
MSNLDFRSHPQERPIFPRFLRNPQQTPKLPMKLIPLTFLFCAFVIFSLTLIYILSQKRGKFFVPKRLFLAGFCSCIAGNIYDFFTCQYDIQRNAMWSGAALLFALVFMK